MNIYNSIFIIYILQIIKFISLHTNNKYDRNQKH